MAYEDLIAGKGWTNLPPPQFGGGLLDAPTNRYQQIMSQMGGVDNYVVPTTTGGYIPSIYNITPEQSQAVMKFNSAVEQRLGGGGGSTSAAAQQAAAQAALAQLTPGEQAAVQAMTIPNLVNFLMPLPLQLLMNVMGIDAPGTTSSGGVSKSSGSPMSGIASKGNVGQVANAVTTANNAIGRAIGLGVGGLGTSVGTTGGISASSGSPMGGMGSGAKGVAVSSGISTGGGVGVGGGVGGGGIGNGSGASSAGGSSAGSAYSDMRMKEDIKPIGNAISKVRKLDGVTFDMNGKRGTGLVAQQVEDVLPEVVHKDANGMRMVDYGNIVGLLVEAIKEMDGKKNKKTKGLLEA
jgi:hypothetical protein